MQKGISQIVHVLLLLLLLLLLPVEETKLKSRSTIDHDIAHVGTWYWWLVHRHKFLTPLLLVILMIISLFLYIMMLQYNVQ